MADMRLIVAGAGGRMGRALTRVISETPGAVRHRRAGSAGFGAAGQGCRRARRAARKWRETLGRSVVAVGQCRRHSGFHRAGRHHRQCGDRGRARPGPRHRHHRPVVIRRRRDQERHRARHRREVGQYEPRRQPAGGAGQARRAVARPELRHRNPGNASPRQDRRAVGHRPDARRGRRRRPRRRSRHPFGARPRRHHRRAAAGRYRLCVAARRHRHRRSQRDLRRRHGTHRRCRIKPRTG